MTNTTRLASIGLLLSVVAVATGIKCWKCGTYSDGVGSITPCPNRSATQLEQCGANDKYCIKYVSELTTVRDCVPTCSEKEWWGARTFCCETDECNGSSRTITATAATLLAIAIFAHYAR